MNSQTVLNSIAAYRATNGGEIPALVVVDDISVECIDYATLVQRSETIDEHRMCDEYRVFVINYSILDYYVDTFPVLYNKHVNTDIKDFMFMLMEQETRP
jgi:hypothetical protein